MAPGPREAPPAPTRPLVVMYVVFVVLAIAQLARGSAVATVITISQVTTSPLISPTSLLVLRSMSAMLIWVSLGSRLMAKVGPLVPEVARFPASRLPPTSVVMGGPIVLTTFTVQCWLLQGLFFSGAAVCSAASLAGALPAAEGDASALALFLVRRLPRAVHVAFEVSLPMALITTSVVTFALIPNILRKGLTPLLFFSTNQQLMHVANLFLMLTELLVTSLPIIPADFTFPLLFGLYYIALAWVWMRRTNIVYYPFLDPTLPPQLSLPIHVGLFAILTLFFAIGCALQALHSSDLLPLPLSALLMYGGAWGLSWTRLKGVPLPPRGETHMPWADARVRLAETMRPVSHGWQSVGTRLR